MDNQDNNKPYQDNNITNNIEVSYWDIDCDCNLLNDLSDDYGFYEDKGTIVK